MVIRQQGGSDRAEKGQPEKIPGRATVGFGRRVGLVERTAGDARLMRYQLGTGRHLSGRRNQETAVRRGAEDLDKQPGGLWAPVTHSSTPCPA